MRSFFRIAFVLAVMIFALSRFVLISPSLAASITCKGDALASVDFVHVDVNEYRLVGSGPGIPSETRVSLFDVAHTVTWVLPGPGSWDVTLEWRRPPTIPGWSVSSYDSALTLKCLKIDSETGLVEGPPAGNLLDGRINNDQTKDVAAPVAVYCADGNIDVYKIDAETGDGTRIISVAQVEGMPESTQLLDSAQGVSLYWLDTGEYQLNASNFEGTPYWINWVGCASGTLIHILN